MQFFNAWVAAVMGLDARVASSMTVLCDGEPAARWTNFHSGEQAAGAAAPTAAIHPRGTSLSEVLLPDDDAITFVAAFSDVKELLAYPELLNLALLTMTGADGRTRVYCFFDEGGRETTLVTLIGASGTPWDGFTRRTTGLISWEAALAGVRDRIVRKGYTPHPAYSVTRLIALLGEVL